MEDSRNFLMSFLLATLLHAMMLYYFTSTLERGTTDIPFHSVNIELGEGKVKITSRGEAQKMMPKPVIEKPEAAEEQPAEQDLAEQQM